MADAYYYSSSAGAMSLVGSIAGDATSITIDDVSGLPASVPFKLVIDPGLSTEEIVKVTVVAGTTLTVTRGWDGTSGQAHANLASVRHMVTAEDLRLSRQHEDSSSEVHGLTGAVVGTNDSQTLTNKDLSDPTNVFPSSLATDAELTAHAATDTGVHGVTGDVVGTSDTQTLTNKTISGADNSFSNVPQSAVTGLGTDLAALDTRLDDLEATPTPGASASKDGQRLHWGTYTSVDVSRSDATGIQTGIPHGAGFTPTVIVITPQTLALQFRAFNFTSTTFDIQVVNSDGSANGTSTFTFSYICGE